MARGQDTAQQGEDGPASWASLFSKPNSVVAAVNGTPNASAADTALAAASAGAAEPIKDTVSEPVPAVEPVLWVGQLPSDEALSVPALAHMLREHFSRFGRVIDHFSLISDNLFYQDCNFLN